MRWLRLPTGKVGMWPGHTFYRSLVYAIIETDCGATVDIDLHDETVKQFTAYFEEWKSSPFQQQESDGDVQSILRRCLAALHEAEAAGLRTAEDLQRLGEALATADAPQPDPRWRLGGAPLSALFNLAEFLVRAVDRVDAREAALRNELSLDTNGFVLLRQKTKCPHFRDIDTIQEYYYPEVVDLVKKEMLRSGQSGVQALPQEPSPDFGSAQKKLLLLNRISLCSKEATSVQEKLLLFKRNCFCSTEAPSVQQKLPLFNRSYFCSTEATSVSQPKVY